MIASDAKWIRDRVWPAAMRKTFAEVPGYYSRCACQAGLTSWCAHDQHDRCHRATPLRSPAGMVGTRTGHPLYFSAPYAHEVDIYATGPRVETVALVWLADRVCRWVCPCSCHAVPQPTQEALFPLEVTS